MTYTLRVRIMVTAILLAALLVMFAATPLVSNVTGLGDTAYAAHCGGSGC